MLPGLAVQAPRWGDPEAWSCEVQERLGDLSIGIRRASVRLALSAPNSCLAYDERAGCRYWGGKRFEDNRTAYGKLEHIQALRTTPPLSGKQARPYPAALNGLEPPTSVVDLNGCEHLHHGSLGLRRR